MKTPREVLSQHHQTADAKLDQIRSEVIAQLEKPTASRHEWLPVFVMLKLWRELIWPCRRIWAGFAVTWMVIFIVNFNLRDTPQPLAAKATRPSPEMIIAFLEREGLLAELIRPRETRVAEPPKPNLPQPRSERRLETLTT